MKHFFTVPTIIRIAKAGVSGLVLSGLVALYIFLSNNFWQPLSVAPEVVALKGRVSAVNINSNTIKTVESFMTAPEHTTPLPPAINPFSALTPKTSATPPERK